MPVVLTKNYFHWALSLFILNNIVLPCISYKNIVINLEKLIFAQLLTSPTCSVALSAPCVHFQAYQMHLI